MRQICPAFAPRRTTGCPVSVALLWLVAGTALLVPTGPAFAADQSPLAANPRLTEAAALYDLWAAEQLAYDGVPGVVVGVVTRDGLAWAKGYGTTDLAGGVQARLQRGRPASRGAGEPAAHPRGALLR